MTDAVPNIFAELHALQEAHPVIERLPVEELEVLGEEGAALAIDERARAIAEMRERPLDCGWVPWEWWLFLLELCEKRLAHPGRVLECLVSGGIRAGKTHVAAMLTVQAWKFAKKATIFCMARREEDSQNLQQKPIESFLPPEVLGGAAGKIKQTKHEKAKFSGGKFTDNQLQRFLYVEDAGGVRYQGGGMIQFRFFTQELESFRGYALTTVWSDEGIPVDHVKALKDRLASRAIETQEDDHRKKMLALKDALTKLVERQPGARRPHGSLLGALMHGVHLITYTPEEGWTPTVRYFMQGAVKPDRWKIIAPELAHKPGVKDARVPLIAYPAESTRLVCYLHTSANKFVNVYPQLSKDYGNADEKTIRIKLYGDAEAAQRSEFEAVWKPDIHLCEWKDLPRDGTIYEVFDPAGAKPWAMGWYLIDALERVWMLQEWPCESVPINDALPGPWAVLSEKDRMNGDEGPAYKARLGWGISRWCRQIWEGRARILTMMAATGKPWQGAVERRKLIDGGREAEHERACIAVERSIIDSRFAGSKVDNPKGGEQVTVLERLFDDANAILCEPAEGVSLDEGDLHIADKLAERVLGDQAALKINRECTNTQFMLANYTVPPHRETTTRKDEACKEWRDLLAYLLLSKPEHVSAARRGWQGGGSF